MIRVVILGSGSVAEAIARAIAASPYTLVQIYARNPERGPALAQLTGCGWTCHPSELAPAEIYLIAVSDTQIGVLSEALSFGDAVVAHTAGSVALEGLSPRISHRGVFYPLQTFTRGRPIDMHRVPLFLEGEDPHTLNLLEGLAHALSQSVHVANSAERAGLHLAAVFACNFTNHLYAVAQTLLLERGLSPELLKPLMAETAAKAIDAPGGAVTVQTGPAVRNDTTTQEQHLKMLSNHPDLQNLYKLLSAEIWETSKKT